MADSKTSALFEVRAVGTEKASRQFTTFERTATGSMTRTEASIGKSLARVAAQYMSLAVGINKAMKVMSSGTEFNKFVETQTMAFSVMMKSAEKAKAQMEELYDFAVKSPLTFKDTASAAKQLMAYGFAAKELVPTMDTLGTVALATGHSLGDIAYVYGTLRSQGRAYSRDLMQFGMRGIPIYEELAKVMGVNVQQIQKLTSQGKVGFKEVERAFQNMTSGGGRFAGMIEQYMDTLTGKLAMFEDIFEKSTGKMMRGATDSYKNFIDEMTELLESDEMQAYFTELNIDIKTLADLLFEVAKSLIKITPLLIKALKVFITYKAVGGVVNIMKNFSEILLNIGGTLMKLSAIGGAGGFLANLGAAGGLFAEGFVMAGPVILATLAPILAALKVIKDIKTDAYMKSSDEAFMEVFSVQAPRDIAIIQGEINQLRVEGLSELQLEARYNEEIVDYVTRTAEKYGQTTDVLAKNLYLQNEISASIAKMLGFDVSGYFAQMQAERARASTLPTPSSAMQRETQYFGTLTGFDPDTFIDPDDVHAYGARAANMYLETFQKTWETEKTKWKGLFTDERQKKLWKDELDDLINTYNDAFATLGDDSVVKSGFSRIMLGRIGELEQLLEKGIGGMSKKVLPELTDWWLPRESEVASTASAIDDMILQRDKAIAAANKEIEQRRKNLNILIESDITSAEREKYQIQLNNLLQEEVDILKYIDTYQDRLKGVALFGELTGGVSGYFEDLKALVAGGGVIKFPSMNDAVNFIKEAYKVAGEIARNAIKHPVTFLADAWDKLTSTASTVGSFAVASAMEGTELGSMKSNDFSSMSIMGTAGTSLASFATSIENVSAILNPLTTAFEAMRGMVEPLTNAALEPLVAIVEQVGEAFGKVLAPFLGLFQIINSIVYGAFAPLLAAIDWVSGGFLWFFDYVIMPVGNTIIKAINAVIRIINKIPGVHIRYLKEISRSTKALKDFADAARNTQDSLKDTISYLQDKLSDIYDKQIDSLQDLYEVGAISATEYEEQVKNLNDKMVDTQDALVSAADKQLETQEEILERLLALYKLQDAIDQGGLSDEQIAKLLEKHGLTSKSLSQVMIDSITTALTRLGMGNTGGGTTGSGQVDIDIATQQIKSELSTLLNKYDEIHPGKFKEYAKRVLDAQIASGAIKRTSISYKQTIDVWSVQYAKAYKDYMKHVKDVVNTGDLKAMENALSQYVNQWSGAIDGSIIEPFTDVVNELKDVLKMIREQERANTEPVPYRRRRSWAELLGMTTVNDAIISPNGKIITTAPDDYLIATKTPGSLGNSNGTNITVNVNVQGSVTTEKELASSISSILYNQKSRGILTA